MIGERRLSRQTLRQDGSVARQDVFASLGRGYNGPMIRFRQPQRQRIRLEASPATGLLPEQAFIKLFD
jgi:hypothetical protein